MKTNLKQELTKQWFKNLQEIICKNIEEIESAKNSHHKIRKMGNKIGEIIRPFLDKIKTRKLKYKAYQDDIVNIKLADRGVVTDWFNECPIGANHLLEN